MDLNVRDAESDMSLVAAVSVVSVMYNSLVYVLPSRVRNLAFTPLNLVVAGLMLFWATEEEGMSLSDLGLSTETAASGAQWGAATGGALALLIYVASRIIGPAPRHLINPEVRDLARPALVRRIVLRIPLGTALPEEVIFRGILLSILASMIGGPGAAAVSSAVFVAWHVAPTTRSIVLQRACLSRSQLTINVVGPLFATYVGGMLLSAVRLASGSLLAAVMIHWAISAVSLLAFSRPERNDTADSTAGVA